MSPAVVVVGAAAEVRDVVETFRRFGVRVPGWEKTLRRALWELTTDYAMLTSAPLVTDLVTSLEMILREGLQPGLALDTASAAAARLVSETRVDGVPQPDDPDWTFEGAGTDRG
jgi:hypothetical protein